jgi:hypothetical protein
MDRRRERIACPCMTGYTMKGGMVYRRNGVESAPARK